MVQPANERWLFSQGTRSKSCISTVSAERRAAKMAASLQMLASFQGGLMMGTLWWTNIAIENDHL